MKTSFILIATILNLTSNANAAPTRIQVLPGKGQTSFTAVGRPAMLNIKGEGEGPSGELLLEQGNVHSAD
jgi:hypothetical protein